MPVTTVTISNQHHAPNPTEHHCKHPPVTYTLNFPIKGAREPQTIPPLVRFCPQSKNALNPPQSKLLTTRACECMILRSPWTHPKANYSQRVPVSVWSWGDPLRTPVNAWSWSDPTHTCECMILRRPYAHLWMYDPEVVLHTPVNVWSWSDPMHICECMIQSKLLTMCTCEWMFLRWSYVADKCSNPITNVNTSALWLMLSTCD